MTPTTEPFEQWNEEHAVEGKRVPFFFMPFRYVPTLTE